ncbi:MAG: helix-turn-helix domain-containing protein [Owenweeksia sp.]|nr:helix-turn-helix domain-containing protein [Owenweeksia sp.]
MKSESRILPRLVRVLEQLGGNIKLARLRRKLSIQQVSERAGINRNTLTAIEKGSPSVSLGNYAQVLMVLGLEKISFR